MVSQQGAFWYSPLDDMYRAVNGRVYHRVTIGDVGYESYVSAAYRKDAKSLWWRRYLDGRQPDPMTRRGPVRVVDLFAGVGGFGLGVGQFLAETGSKMINELAVDLDRSALAIHQANHDTKQVVAGSVADLVDYDITDIGRDARFVTKPVVASEVSGSHGADLVVAGPPCQGHSILNVGKDYQFNDPRNLLYLTVPAFAVAIDAKSVIIENVHGVLNDKTVDVIRTSQALLESSGYRVTRGLLKADAMGWPQTRHRYMLIASRDKDPIPLDRIADLLADEPRPIMWVIGGNQAVSPYPIMNATANHEPETRTKIDWLFDNNSYVPNPDHLTHSQATTGFHSYKRLHPDKPSVTIVGSFTNLSCGRHIHPTKRRELTLGEGARIQSFPTTYKWVVGGEEPSRTSLATWIGNAVPMPLGYASALSALGPYL